MATHQSSTILPIIALLTSQLVTSSWHVLGKHVMHTVPYVTPMTYVLIRTGITACMLLIAGRICEGQVDFPSLFLEDSKKGDAIGEGCITEKTPSSGMVSLTSTESNGVGLALSRSGSIESMGLPAASFAEDKKMEDQASLPQGFLQNHNPPYKTHNPSQRRRKKGKSSPQNGFCTILTILINLLQSSNFPWIQQPAKKIHQMRSKQLNMEAFQIICAGLSGMLLLPLTYTTGLVLTTPTVASVWDGPMIPLGCFLAAVGLGLEKRSEMWPRLQVSSLLLTVGGSIVVLLIDYTGGGGSDESHGGNDAMRNTGKSQHWEGRTTHEFLQGNMVLMGVVAAYSSMALLQKQLKHHPPMTLTGWMFGVGFVGCICLVLLDSLLVTLGVNISGCTLHQCLQQICRALTTSPTFRYGLLYSCFFVGGVCFSIASYAASHLESSVITLFAACQPPMTAVLEWIWEGKGLGWKKIGGMLCVGVGMWCFTYIKRLEKERKETENLKRRSNRAVPSDVAGRCIEIGHVMHNGRGFKRKGNQTVTNRSFHHADV